MKRALNQPEAISFCSGKDPATQVVRLYTAMSTPRWFPVALVALVALCNGSQAGSFYAVQEASSIGLEAEYGDLSVTKVPLWADQLSIDQQGADMLHSILPSRRTML